MPPSAQGCIYWKADTTTFSQGQFSRYGCDARLPQDMLYNDGINNS